MKFKFAFVLVFGLLTIIGPENVHSFKKLKKIKKMMLLAPFVKPFTRPNLHFVVPLSPLKGKSPCPPSHGPAYDPCYEPKPEPVQYPTYEPPSDPCYTPFQMPSFNLPPIQLPSFPTLQLPSLFPRGRPCPPKPCPPPHPRPIRPNPCPPNGVINNRPQYPSVPLTPSRPVLPQHTPQAYNRPNYEYNEPDEYYQQNNINDYDEYSNARRPIPEDFQQVINKYTQQSWREQSEQQQRNQFRGNIGSDGYHQGQKIMTNFDDQEEYSQQQQQQPQQNNQKYYNPRQSPLGNTEWKAIKTSRPAPQKPSAGEPLIEKSVKSPLADVSRGAKSTQQPPPSHKHHHLNILSPVQAVKSKQQQIERLQQQQIEHTFQHQQASIIPARAEVAQSGITGTTSTGQQQQQQQPNYQTPNTVEQSTIPY